MIVKTLIFFGAVSAVTANPLRGNCRDLAECDSLLWILQNYETINMSYREVMQDFYNRLCGYKYNTSSYSPMLNCPIEYEEEISETNFVGYGSFPRSDQQQERHVDSGGVFRGNEGGFGRCSGTLKLHHRDPINISDIRVSLFSRKSQYLRLQFLDGRSVYRIEVNGDCCWRMYKGRMKNGETKTVGAGYDQAAEMQPRSLEKTLCV